jgi:hypothetical protein
VQPPSDPAAPAAPSRSLRNSGVEVIKRLVVPGQGVLGHALEDALDHHRALCPAEVRADAEMNAVSEGQMTVGLPVDAYLVRFVEGSLVPVGRREPQAHPVALRDLLAGDAYILDGGAGQERDRAVVAEELLDRGREQARIGDEPLTLADVDTELGQGAKAEFPGRGHAADDDREADLVDLRVG